MDYHKIFFADMIYIFNLTKEANFSYIIED